MGSILHLTLLVASLSMASSQLGASFGEPCGPDTNCDPRALLTCIENSCGCIKPKEMSYDQTKQKCLVVSGAKCIYAANEKLDCVPDATCTSTGVCECTLTHFESEKKLCLPKRPYGESCTEENSCQDDKLLSCVEGKCSCNATEAVFDPVKNKCAGRVGASCQYEAYRYSGTEYDTCMTNSQCAHSDGQGAYHCVCQSSYTKTTNRLCALGHGQDYNNASPCAPPLVCSFEPQYSTIRCKCPFPKHQSYNSTTNECVSYVDGPCLEKVKEEVVSFPCVPNAICGNSSGIHKCTCLDGWIESTGRKCALTHGQPCEIIRYPSRSGNALWTHLCDEVAGLACRSGVCSCGELEIYDPKSAKCRGMVGAGCVGDPEMGNYCIDNAHCALYRGGGTEKKGLCKCTYSYKPTSDRARCSFHPVTPSGNTIQS